jgi:hypothetical protein
LTKFIIPSRQQAPRKAFMPTSQIAKGARSSNLAEDDHDQLIAGCRSVGEPTLHPTVEIESGCHQRHLRAMSGWRRCAGHVATMATPCRAISLSVNSAREAARETADGVPVLSSLIFLHHSYLAIAARHTRIAGEIHRQYRGRQELQ